MIRRGTPRAAHHAGHTSAERADAQHSISRDSAATARASHEGNRSRTMAGRPPRREYDGDAPGAPGGIMPLRARELVMRGSPGKVYERPVTAGGTRRKPSLKTKSQTSLRRPSTAGSTGGRTLRRPKDRATLSQQEATKHFSLSLELSDALVNFASSSRASGILVVGH